MRVPRSIFADCSPRTQLMASLRLDLPQPFGPTTAATPLPENRISVRSQNDLNPWISIRLRMSKGVYLIAQAIGFGTSGAKAHAKATRGGDSKVTRCGLEVNNHGTGFWGCFDSTARCSRLARERYKENHVHRPPLQTAARDFDAPHSTYKAFVFHLLASLRQAQSRALAKLRHARQMGRLRPAVRGGVPLAAQGLTYYLMFLL
jgi:hypothetical protein